MLIFVICLLLGCGVLAYVLNEHESEKMSRMSTHAKADYIAKKREDAEAIQFGRINGALVCPHCQQTGKVHTKANTKKAGVSGGKATGALLTGGVSLLATGLSRKEKGTQAYCGHCKSTWFFS